MLKYITVEKYREINRIRLLTFFVILNAYFKLFIIKKSLNN